LKKIEKWRGIKRKTLVLEVGEWDRKRRTFGGAMVMLRVGSLGSG